MSIDLGEKSDLATDELVERVDPRVEREPTGNAHLASVARGNSSVVGSLCCGEIRHGPAHALVGDCVAFRGECSVMGCRLSSDVVRQYGV